MKIAWVAAAALVMLAVAARAENPYRVDRSIDAFGHCEKAVREHLKAPRTARFNHDLNVKAYDVHAKGYQGYSITGTVDAQNSFGALLRARYECIAKYFPDRKTWTADAAVDAVQ